MFLFICFPLFLSGLKRLGCFGTIVWSLQWYAHARRKHASYIHPQECGLKFSTLFLFSGEVFTMQMVCCWENRAVERFLSGNLINKCRLGNRHQGQWHRQHAEIGHRAWPDSESLPLRNRILCKILCLIKQQHSLWFWVCFWCCRKSDFWITVSL